MHHQITVRNRSLCLLYTIRIILVPKPTPPVQQPIPSWDDEFEPSDVAKTVVEATLADV